MDWKESCVCVQQQMEEKSLI